VLVVHVGYTTPCGTKSTLWPVRYHVHPQGNQHVRNGARDVEQYRRDDAYILACPRTTKPILTHKLRQPQVEIVVVMIRHSEDQHRFSNCGWEEVEGVGLTWDVLIPFFASAVPDVDCCAMILQNAGYFWDAPVFDAAPYVGRVRDDDACTKRKSWAPLFVNLGG